MKVKVVTLVVLTIIFSGNLSAQKNLVPNGSFDEVEKKIKGRGMIEMAAGWTSPHADKADLFSNKAKIETFLTPSNMYGKEEVDLGGNYAGIVGWSYKNYKPTTYLQSELIKPMEAGKVYCVKYLISLSDLSKYATNNVGLFLSNTKMEAKDIDKNEIKPQVKHSNNIVIDETFTWTPICNMYTSEGGEKFLTIGNFSKPSETMAKKVKRPKGFNKPQVNLSYLYIESVSVIPMDSLRDDECICEKQAGTLGMKVVHRENTSEAHRLEDLKKIEETMLYYDSMAFELSEIHIKALDKIVETLKSETGFKVEILGHTDVSENGATNGELSQSRADAAQKYIVSKGIEETRVTTKGLASERLVSKYGLNEKAHLNRRVTFRVL